MTKKTIQQDAATTQPRQVDNMASMGCGLIRAKFAAILTDHEQKVLKPLVQHGMTNKEIAREIGRTEASVKMHIKAINAKLGTTNRTQLALILVGVAQETPAGRAYREAREVAS